MDQPCPTIVKIPTAYKQICIYDKQGRPCGNYDTHRYAIILVIDDGGWPTYYCYDCAVREPVIGPLILLMGWTWP